MLSARFNMTKERSDKKDKKTTKQAADDAEGESAVLAAIAAMPEPYRAMGKRLQDEEL